MHRLPSIVAQHIVALRGLLLFTVILGLAYPVVIFGIGQGLFHNQANGSPVSFQGKVVGSSLLCQEFVDAKGNPLPQYFQPRPSAAVNAAVKTDYGCDPGFSAASNLGPDNPVLVTLIKQRQQQIAAFDHVEDLGHPARRGDRVGVRPGPVHLAPERRHPGEPGGRCPAHHPGGGHRAGQQVHPGPHAWASSGSPGSTCSS